MHFLKAPGDAQVPVRGHTLSVRVLRTEHLPVFTSLLTELKHRHFGKWLTQDEMPGKWCSWDVKSGLFTLSLVLVYPTELSAFPHGLLSEEQRLLSDSAHWGPERLEVDAKAESSIPPPPPLQLAGFRGHGRAGPSKAWFHAPSVLR